MESSRLPHANDHKRARTKAIEAVDPASYLLADHAWLRSVLGDLEHLSDESGRLGELHAGILELAPLIDTHIRLEEEAFFPAIEEFVRKSRRGSTEDMYGEHDAIRIRLEQLLAALSHYGSTASAELAAFSRSLLNHFDNEEELLFTDLLDQLSDATRQDVLSKFASISEANFDTTIR